MPPIFCRTTRGFGCRTLQQRLVGAQHARRCWELRRSTSRRWLSSRSTFPRCSTTVLSLFDLGRGPPAPPPQEADDWLRKAAESFVAVDQADTSRRSEVLKSARVNRLAALSARGEIQAQAGAAAMAEELFVEACGLVELEALGDWSLGEDAEAMYNLGDTFTHRAALRIEACDSPEGADGAVVAAAQLLEEAAGLGQQALAAYEAALQAEPPGPAFDCSVLLAASETATNLATGLLAAEPQPPAEGRVVTANGFAEAASRHSQTLLALCNGSGNTSAEAEAAAGGDGARARLQLGLALSARARAQWVMAGGAPAAAAVAEATSALEAAAADPAAAGELQFESCAAAGELLLDFGRLMDGALRSEVLTKAAAALDAAAGLAAAPDDAVLVAFNLGCVAALIGNEPAAQRWLDAAVQQAEAASGGGVMPLLTRWDLAEDEDLAGIWAAQAAAGGGGWLTALQQRLPE